MTVRNRKVKSRARKVETKIVDGCEYKMYNSRFIDGFSAIHISDHMTGKMQDVPSISTSCLINPYCKARLENGIGICKHCFANATLKMRPVVRKNMAENYEILSQHILPKEVLPKFCDDVEIVRLESFGDVGTATQAINYLNIVRKNPHVFFAAWTKNAMLWSDALKWGEGKPENLNLVISSLELNRQRESIPRWADIVFTVWEKDKKPPKEINCGARSCDKCRSCYRKYGNEIKVINEYLK